MNVYPVLIDSRPDYLTGAGETASLLLVPLGTRTLIEHLLSRFDADLKQHAPVVFAPPGADSSYRRCLEDACPGVTSVSDWAALGDVLGTCEPSDALLIVDPRRFPMAGFSFGDLRLHARADSRWAIHLVTFEKGVGTKEFVDLDSAGRVRRIQRYYNSVTWPFITGVAASLIPVSSGVLDESFASTSLWELRSRLTACGVPGHDRAMTGAACDLNNEAEFLAASEHFIREATAGREGGGLSGLTLLLGDGHVIDPTARLIGPVILHEGAVVGEDARIIGPAVVGARARIGEGAVVAQACVGRDCVIPAWGVVRHRVLFQDSPPVERPASPAPREREPFSERPKALPRTEHEGDRIPKHRSSYLGIKRVLDVAISAFALVVLAPILAVIAVLIRLDSRGSVFYSHEREGRDGRIFPCWKFRTMYQGAAAQERELYAVNLMDGPQFKLSRDPRISRAGRILRATNLDEVPQLFNVLVGDMSLVGPRPSPFRENQTCVPWREARLSVRPGITGLWQVCRHDREISDFHQWIEYDLLYVQHARLWLDLKILAATILTFGGKSHIPRSWMVSLDPANDTSAWRGRVQAQ